MLVDSTRTVSEIRQPRLTSKGFFLLKKWTYLVEYSALKVFSAVLSVHALQLQMLSTLPQHRRPLSFLDAFHFHGGHIGRFPRKFYVYQTVDRRCRYLVHGSATRTTRFRVVVARVLVRLRVYVPCDGHVSKPTQRLTPGGCVVVTAYRVLLFHDDSGRVFSAYACLKHKFRQYLNYRRILS